jgi:hypothetical protein
LAAYGTKKFKFINAFFKVRQFKIAVLLRRRRNGVQMFMRVGESHFEGGDVS